MIATIMPILQLLLAALPEFEAVWPTLSKLLSTGKPPAPADMATLWTAAAALHARVQGAPTPVATTAPPANVGGHSGAQA